MVYVAISLFSKENKVLFDLIFKWSIKGKLPGDKNSSNY